MAFKSIGALAREVLVKARNGNGDLHVRGAGDGSPTTGERGGDETGAGEEIHPAPSPMLSGGDEAAASKGRKNRGPEASAVGAVREEVSPRGKGDGVRHEATGP